jgi:hypothetical protein
MVAVALHPRDAVERRVELFGDDLPECRGYSRAQLDFPAEDSDRTVRSDHEPGVDLVGGKGDEGGGMGDCRVQQAARADREADC